VIFPARLAPIVVECNYVVMKVMGLFLLVAGWILVVTAIAMLRPGFVGVFVIAGLGVELLGFGLFARAQALVARNALRERS
jgi:hypothetical protein